MIKRLFLLMILISSINVFAQRTSTIKGIVKDLNGKALGDATVLIEDSEHSTTTNQNGEFRFNNVKFGKVVVKVSHIGHESSKQNIVINNRVTNVYFNMIENSSKLQEIEVFGKPNVQPKGLESITRLPLKPSDQIQSISVISQLVIEEQGALSITDVAKNVPGVTLFSSYGGVKESMSMRGFRGTPVLKNGVRMDSQFQTASGISDMQGIESVQVIKGSAAITQGVITDIGNAGGVINLVTKTPQFINAGEVSMRAGSWGQFRPTFDIQNVIDNNNKLAVRVNGAFERGDNYRPVVELNKTYINPSLEWRPDDKTFITLEADYLKDNRTPVASATNLGNITENKLYLIPKDNFAGFSAEKNEVNMNTFSASFKRNLTEKFNVRLAYVKSNYDVDATSSSFSTVVQNTYNKRRRTLSRSLRDDNNSTLQLDFIGQDLKTGNINHTFQIGFDYRIADARTTSLGSSIIDTIDLYAPINNNLNKKITFNAASPVLSYYSSYGVMAQDVITFNRYVKAILGLRYSDISGTKSLTTVAKPSQNAWNPSIGVMISPIQNLNVFGSYTNSTSLGSASNLMSNGEEIGPSVTDQFEIGIKSDWLNNRLRFNFTYFDINTGNLSNSEYIPGTNLTTGYYFKAGDLRRKGIETELNGRVLSNLQVMIGYAYLDAAYANSPSYVNGSAPMNTPKHTANSWVNYAFLGKLKGLSLGFGAYYVGERPVNEYSLKPDGHGTPVGSKPFDMPSYYTLNAQVGYKFKNITLRGYFNNFTNQVGLNSYFRGGFINQIDPANFAATVSYKF